MAKHLCRMCDKERPQRELSAHGICAACIEEHGLPEHTPPLRPAVPCGRCAGGSFVRCLAIRERAATGGDYVSEYVAPLAATYANEVHETLFRGRAVHAPDVKQPRGVFEAYICRRCGFTELYAQKPDEIPIGPEHATELFEVGGDGPYRGGS